MKDSKVQPCIVAGMPRASTTFLYHTLGSHPEVFVPSRKETDFFCDLNANRSEAWYSALYKGCKQGQVPFDMSPHYFMDPLSPERIMAYNPNVKVILMLRDPVSWAKSYYVHLRKIFFRKFSFEQFIEEGFDFTKEGNSLYFDLSEGFIERQLKSYKDTFGDHLLCCDFEQVKKNPKSLLATIESFVGLSPYFEEHGFSNDKIMSSDRRSTKLLNYLKRQRVLVDSVQKYMPKVAIDGFQSFLALWAVRGYEGDYTNGFTEQQDALLRKRYNRDIKCLEELFKDGPFVLGSGNSYGGVCQGRCRVH